VTLVAVAAACVLTGAFWNLGRAAAARRDLAPGAFHALTLAAPAVVAYCTTPSLAALAAVCGTSAAGAVDARTGAIPDPLSAATALLAFAFAAAQASLSAAVLGTLVGGGTLLALHAISAGRGLGLGDVKLGAAIGAGLGPSSGILALGTAFVLGGIVATLLLLSGRARRGAALRFGPFLAAGACLAALAPAGIPW
jgi:leader peptidase (prepilin peptidase) / N-methyltransferase